MNTQIAVKTPSRLEQLFVTKLRPALKDTLNLSNIMEVPKISKIVVNVGVKEAVTDSKILPIVVQTIARITGQAPVKRAARKSIAGFKIREGMQLGVCVTLRGKKMYDFLDRLINLALPRVRDFQGVPTKFDGRGNYNLGIKEWNIFPEAETTTGTEKVHGLNITIHTTAIDDRQGFELMKSLGIPFKKSSTR